LLSDNFDRRKVLILVSGLFIFLSLILIIIGYNNFSFEELTIIYFIFGGLSFTFYPVALSMVCDRLRSSHIVSATQCLSIVEGIGSIVGPILAPPFMKIFGLKGLSIYFAIVASCLILFLIYRTIKQEKNAHHNHFVLALHTTPIIAELDPRGEDK
jgi:MFS family permease